MKQRVTAIILTLALVSPIIAQAQNEKEAPAPIVAINQAFSNLPKKTREDYAKKIIKVQNLFSRRRHARPM